ncbi:hypothetical protein CQA49_08155 [Helicobacter sp. MIT 00-7814]|nr:hypothetical protein CQA37_09430 [Helicobacter sp. MIT 99-10781]RDU52578.1 hypothetical protein CQA49_08155 [Helicobacter sp. MIT 00-7814]
MYRKTHCVLLLNACNNKKRTSATKRAPAQKNSSIVRKIFAKARKTRKELPKAVVTKRFLRLCEKIACKANF